MFCSWMILFTNNEKVVMRMNGHAMGSEHLSRNQKKATCRRRILKAEDKKKAVPDVAL